MSAEDAKYVVDGVVGTGPTNTVVLQNGQVEVDLGQALDEVIVVKIGRDRAAVAAATQQFVEDFNDLLALLGNGTVAQATKAKNALSGQIREQVG
jgi:flagellar capping protein FliD